MQMKVRVEKKFAILKRSFVTIFGKEVSLFSVIQTLLSCFKSFFQLNLLKWRLKMQELKFWGLAVGSWADWVSGIGAIFAIVMVFWQVKKQQNADTKSFQRIKELEFSSARPLFTFNLGDYFYKVNSRTYTLLTNSQHSNLTKFRGFALKNISVKQMMAVEIHVNYESLKSDDVFRIDRIAPNDVIYLELCEIDESVSIKKNLDDRQVKSVNVYLTTEIREKIKLCFKNNQNMLVCYSSQMENKDGLIYDSEYGLTGFIESEKVDVSDGPLW